MRATSLASIDARDSCYHFIVKSSLLIEKFFIKSVVFIGLRKNDYIIENRYIKI